MIEFVGSASCKLDDKFRLALPSKFLKQLEGKPENNKFIIKPSLHLPCIEIYPKVNWDVTMGWLRELDQLRPEVQKYMLYFLRDHQYVQLDKSNRLLIPGELISHADIGKEVMLSSQLHILQLWNHGKYKTRTGELPEDFDEITRIALNTKNG